MGLSAGFAIPEREQGSPELGTARAGITNAIQRKIKSLLKLHYVEAVELREIPLGADLNTVKAFGEFRH